MPPRLPLEQVFFEGKYREVDKSVAEDWLSQMVAGYKAQYPMSSFEKQLRLYESKIGRAEADLRSMVYYRSGLP
jgi:hypothetical protein